MTRTALRSFAITATLAALVAGCTSTPPPEDPTSSSTEAPSSTAAAPTTETETTDVPVADDELPVLQDIGGEDYQPDTRTEELALALSEAREPTLQQAIDALDLYQPVPGATPTTLPQGDGLGATYTLTLVGAFKDRMSPEQRAVLDALDEGRHVIGTITADNEIVPDDTTGTGSVTAPPTAPATGTEAAAPATSTTAPGFWEPGRSALLPRDEKSKLLYTEQKMRDVMKAWQQHRPDLPHPAVQFSWSQTSLADHEMTSSRPSTSTPGLVEITMYNDLWDSPLSWMDIEFIFAAEYFRAIQFTFSSGLTAQSPWVVQGSSEWAAYDLYRKSFAPDASRTLAGWFKKQATPLDARSGSAWPFFESLRQYGVDPYPKIKTLLGTGAGSVKYLLAAAGVDGMPFASFRSSQSMRRTEKVSREFFMDWPGPGIAFGPQDNFDTADAHGLGTFTVFGGKDYSHPQWAIPFTSDVDTVTISPNDTVTTVTADGVLSIPAGASITLCVREGACECPEGAGGSLPMASLPLVISLPEQSAMPSAALRDDTFKKSSCKSTPRTGHAIGDPHMVTFDGTVFDLIVPGEYVLLRDPASKAQVQIRVSTDNARIAAVAVTSGDGHRVTITDPAQDTDPPVLRRDGQQVDAADPALAGEWQITDGGKTFRFDGPDGLTVGVAWTSNGINLTAVAEKPSAGRLEGLLGDANGIVGDDFRLPDGTMVAAATDDYVSSWWVTDDTTLFDYEDGKTTASYRKPRPALPAPSEKHRSDCRTALGSDAIEQEVAMCAFDIAVTGETEAVTTIYVNVVRDRVDNFPSLIDQPGLGDDTGDDATASTTTGPSVGAVTGDGPALTLTATINSYGEATGGTPSGGLSLKGGTVLVARSTGCPAGREVSVKVTYHDHSREGVQATVCSAGDRYSTDLAPVIQGEAYVAVGTTGDYDVTLAGSSSEEFATTVEIFADPSPQVVEADAFDSTGYTGTLDGIGKAVLAWSDPGESTVHRTASGDIGELCVDTIFDYEFIANGGLADLESKCGHNPDQSTNPFQGQLPSVVFSRTPGKHSITIKAG